MFMKTKRVINVIIVTKRLDVESVHEGQKGHPCKLVAKSIVKSHILFDMLKVSVHYGHYGQKDYNCGKGFVLLSNREKHVKVVHES